ncbi:MAG: hypothetical protein U0W24_26115 [Bacteroidales bacterium]
MRKVILAAAVLFISMSVFGQNPLAKGGKQLNAGLGFSNHGLPIYFGMDFGVHPDVSIGGEICFRSYHKDHYRNNGIGFLFNGNYHFNKILQIPSEWDFYAGLNLGFTFWNYDEDYNGDEYTGLGLGAQIGGRYFITKKFGLNLEINGGNASSGGKFGITYQF